MFPFVVENLFSTTGAGAGDKRFTQRNITMLTPIALLTAFAAEDLLPVTRRVDKWRTAAFAKDAAGTICLWVWHYLSLPANM